MLWLWSLSYLAMELNSILVCLTANSELSSRSCHLSEAGEESPEWDKGCDRSLCLGFRLPVPQKPRAHMQAGY